MALTCSISNECPEEPVLSPVSGHIFEKRLIEKYIEENGCDPITTETLTADMLIAVKAPAVAKPRPPSTSSIPAILKMLQDEWDAVMLHSFTLRQELQTARQELSHALYLHDAACRVIVRLSKEVAAAREALATLKPQATGAAAAAPAAAADTAQADSTEPIGISPEVLSSLQETADRLTLERKKKLKVAPEGLATIDLIGQYRQTASNTGVHSASIPGILALDISQNNPSRVVTGGNDKTAVVFDCSTEQMVCVLKGHTKKVSAVVYHPTEELVFTGSPDSTVRVWGVQQGQCAHVLRVHSDEVTAISLHATGDYILSASADSFWAFSDVRTGKVLSKKANTGDDQRPVGLSSAQFHPDGLIFGTGTQDSVVKIWDLKEGSNVASFTGHSGRVSSICFSENGYYLASAGEDSQIKLWDLRKLKNFRTLSVADKFQIHDLCFDMSGSYLAVAGTDVRVYVCKQWQEIKCFNDHTALATAVRFGPLSSFIVTASMDRSLKTFGPPTTG